MSDIALAAYAKVPGAEPAVALILNGQVFDLQEARKAGLKLDEAWAENSVPRNRRTMDT